MTFHNPDNGFCVLRVKARGQRDLVTVIGHAALISAGEFVQAAGTWTDDRDHGLHHLRYPRIVPVFPSPTCRKLTSSNALAPWDQGLAGALKLLINPNARAGDVVGDKAVRVNGGDPNATAGQFASRWTAKFGDPGPVAQSTIAAGFNTPFNGAPIGANPNGFSGGAPSGPLPAMAAMGTGMVPNASGFSQQAAPAPQQSLAPVSYADQSAAGTAVASGTIPGGTPQGQPYGSVPLNVGGHMLTRQQAEDTDGYDHGDYDAAAVNAGLIPSLAAAPAFSDGIGQWAAASPSLSPGTALAPSPAALQMQAPPPAPPTSSNAAFTITPAMIGALVKNPDTQAFGL